jgi:hypothetical protein
MDIGSIFLILALLVLVGFFVSQPFLERKQAANVSIANSKDHELSSLLAERDRVLNALQELDFDNALGKIPSEDYSGQRERLLEYGADVLRKLDALENQPGNGEVSTLKPSAEDRIEATIAAHRADAIRVGVSIRPATNGGKVVSAAVAAPDDDVEVMLANRRRILQSDTAGFCPKCGTALQKSDKFCPKCGTKIN